MKKIVSAIAGATLLAGSLAAPTVPLAAKSDNAAEIVKDGGCFGFVPDGNGGATTGLFNPEGAHAVSTKSGNVTLVCQFDIPEGFEPAKAVKATGFLCGTYFGLTNDSWVLATPGGKATLVCKIKGNS